MREFDLVKGLVDDDEDKPGTIPSNWHPGKIAEVYRPEEIERELGQIDSKKGLLTRALKKARKATGSLEA